MLEPNDSDSALDRNGEEAKSDYFSDEGDVKLDVAMSSSENMSLGKRKLDGVDTEKIKKIKVTDIETSATFQNKLEENVESASTKVQETSEFIRASSVTSDNSDEFVDASDVLEPPLEMSNNKNLAPTKSSDAVDFCHIKLKSEVPKPPQSGKIINKPLRLPTFADDPLERFKSSALRRGFIKDLVSEPQKHVEVDFSLDDKFENKGLENKPVKKVKLNRSKFLSTEKPKFSDESSSDSNSRFNTSTSPIKSEILAPEKGKSIDSDETKIPRPSEPQSFSTSIAKSFNVEQKPTYFEKMVETASVSTSIIKRNAVEPKIMDSEKTDETPLPLDKITESSVLELKTTCSEKADEPSSIPESKLELNVSGSSNENDSTSSNENDSVSETILVSEKSQMSEQCCVQMNKISDSQVLGELENITVIKNVDVLSEEKTDEKAVSDPQSIPVVEEISILEISEPVISENPIFIIKSPKKPTKVDDLLEEIQTSESASEKFEETLPAMNDPEPDSVEKPADSEPAVLECIEDSKPVADASLSDNSENLNKPFESVKDIYPNTEEKLLDTVMTVESSVPITDPIENEPVSSTNTEESMEVNNDFSLSINQPSNILENSSSEEIPKPKELSKLELALTGGIPIKKLEIQLQPLNEELLHNASCEFTNEIQSSLDKTETEKAKEDIKLHLSLQGDKISIKKGPLISSTGGEVRIKRKYTKRNKDGLKAKADYKLRNRTVKKDGKIIQLGGGDVPQLVHSHKSGEIEIVNTQNSDNNIEIKATDNVEISSSVDLESSSNVDLDLEEDDKFKKAAAPGKVQPIKLKITKNIECGSSYTASVEEPLENPSTTVAEDVRKKDNSFPNYMEQAATAWSGPDLQRVERLLKESNITITPVMSKEPVAQLPSTSILKPMLTSTKSKSTTASQFNTPSVSTSGLSLRTTTASITSILNRKLSEPSSEDDASESSNMASSDHKSSGEMDDQNEHYQSRSANGYDTTPSSSSDQFVDVKSEIRKKLASAERERRKQEFSKESTDSESESFDPNPKSNKSVPDLLPINMPPPEILQSLSSSINAAENDIDSKAKKDFNAALLPLLQTLPKKRGRPTKAMVAARNALKQSQEVALENLKQLAKEKNEEGVDIMSHFPIPLFDITDPEDLFKTRKGRKSKVAADKSDGDQSGMEDPILDPIREMEELKRLDEERQKKEEEKERRNEIRRQKAKERNDLMKAKRLRQKMKADERQKRMQEKRRLLQEEKKKLEEEIKNLPSLHNFDDETRMSAENSQLQTTSYSIGIIEDDSSGAPTETSQRIKKSRMEVADWDSKDLTVDQIAEYQWPIQGGELYMIQEQVSNYLGVKSFKRKYPDIKRRPVDSEERAYLVDSGLVSESLCDLGLTAVCSAELLDIMCADFPDKYEELRKYMREKQMKELSFKQKAWANGLGYKLLMADGTKQDLKKRAMESASNWNSALNKSRIEDRRCAMDLQTFIVHYPKNKTRRMTIPTPKVGSYPVSILPGQFCDFYKKYNSTELRYMPVNTVMYGPLKNHSMAALADGSQTDSDDSSSSDESSSTTSEGTQATEDTIEDTDKDMSVDESSQHQDNKLHEMNGLKEISIQVNDITRDNLLDETQKILCKVCLGNVQRNKENVPEVLICCSQCASTSHPTCLDLSLDMVTHIKKYAWMCPDCKICARCKENADEDKMLFCDACDRGYHIYCVGLRKVPSGRWQCQECTVESTNFAIPGLRDVFQKPGLIEIQDG